MAETMPEWLVALTMSACGIQSMATEKISAIDPASKSRSTI